MNSTFGNRLDNDSQTAILTIHFADAEPRGITSGDPVLLFNDRGRCMMRAEVSDSVASGVVVAPSVRWPKLAPDGNSVNM